MSILVDDLRDAAMPPICDQAADEIEELERAYELLFKENARLRSELEASQQTSQRRSDVIERIGIEAIRPLCEGLDKPTEFAISQARGMSLASIWRTAERERMCAAIKAADDKASEGDYMLDSEDCIKVIRGTWPFGPNEASPAA